MRQHTAAGALAAVIVGLNTQAAHAGEQEDAATLLRARACGVLAAHNAPVYTAPGKLSESFIASVAGFDCMTQRTLNDEHTQMVDLRMRSSNLAGDRFMLDAEKGARGWAFTYTEIWQDGRRRVATADADNGVRMTNKDSPLFANNVYGMVFFHLQPTEPAQRYADFTSKKAMPQ